MGSGMHFPFRSWALSDQNDRLTLRGDFRDVIVFFFLVFNIIEQKYIIEFGGDPSKVTLFGESGKSIDFTSLPLVWFFVKA